MAIIYHCIYTTYTFPAWGVPTVPQRILLVDIDHVTCAGVCRVCTETPAQPPHQRTLHLGGSAALRRRFFYNCGKKGRCGESRGLAVEFARGFLCVT